MAAPATVPPVGGATLLPDRIGENIRGCVRRYGGHELPGIIGKHGAGHGAGYQRSDAGRILIHKAAEIRETNGVVSLQARDTHRDAAILGHCGPFAALSRSHRRERVVIRI